MLIPPAGGGGVAVGADNALSSRLPRRTGGDGAFIARIEIPPKDDPTDDKLLVTDSSSEEKVPSYSQRSRIRLRNIWRKELQYGMRVRRPYTDGYIH
jgi:hypothetical protein